MKGGEKLTADVALVRTRAYAGMLAVMKEYAGQGVFPLDKTAHCITCEKPCFVHPPGIRRPKTISLGASCSDSSGSGDESAACLPSLNFNGASTTCVGWTPSGTRTNTAHHSMKSFYMWVAERLEIREDIIFHENANLFLSEKYIHDELGSDYDCITVRVGPQD